MTGEKESLDSQAQKPPTLFHPPSLAASGKGSLNGQHHASSRSDSFQNLTPSNNGGGSSNYQNVTQKGKLILPTAIWILIVVGGLCFLSLLSSLNKTINTLDELVEIEQSNAKMTADTLDHHHKHHHHRNSHQLSSSEVPVVERLEWTPDSVIESDLKLDDEAKSLASSLLRMPLWTSLDKSDFHESSRRGDQQKPQKSIQSVIDNMIQAATGGRADSAEPMEGTFFIATMGGDSEPNQAPMSPSQNQFESIMNQLMREVGGNQAASAQVKVDSGEGSMLPAGGITANIDKLNININNGPTSSGQDDEVSSNSKSNKKDSPNHAIDGEEEAEEKKQEKIKSLDESIDNLIKKLMSGEPQQQVMESNRMQLPGLFMSQSPSQQPDLFDLERVHHQPGRHTPHAGRIPHPSSSSSFELPPPSAPQAMIDNLVRPSMFGLPDGAQFVIALDGNDSPLQAPISRKSPVSPYELVTNNVGHPPHHLPHHHHHSHRHPHRLIPPGSLINMPSADIRPTAEEERLINSLAQSLLPQGQQENKQQEPADGNKRNNEQAPDSIVFINGEPLSEEDKKKLFGEESDSLFKAIDNGNKDSSEQAKQNHVKDLFTMFFGPPPSSNLFSPPPTAEPTMEPKILTTAAPEQEQSNEQQQQLKKDQTNEVPVVVIDNEEPAKEKSATSSDMSGSLIEIKDLPKEESATSSDSSVNVFPEPSKGLEHLMDGLVGGMFSLPQFANDESMPIQVEAQSSGNRQVTSDSPILQSTTSPPSTTGSNDGVFEIRKFEFNEPGKVEKVIVLDSSTTSVSSTTESAPAVTTAAPAVILLTSELTSQHPSTASITPEEPILTTPKNLDEITRKMNLDKAIEPEQTTTPTPAIQSTTTSPVSSQSPEEPSTTLKPSTSSTTMPVTSIESGKSSSSPAPIVTSPSLSSVASNSTTQKPAVPKTGPQAHPVKAFLQKADDFIGRNIMSIRRFLS